MGDTAERCHQMCSVARCAVSPNVQCRQMCSVARCAVSPDVRCRQMCSVARCAVSPDVRCRQMWMLRAHRAFLLNWFRVKGPFSSGVVEGFSIKAKPTSGKSFGFRTCHGAETALYHVLGALPEPESTHRFC